VALFIFALELSFVQSVLLTFRELLDLFSIVCFDRLRMLVSGAKFVSSADSLAVYGKALPLAVYTLQLPAAEQEHD
jgi:hypothetical protein